MSLTRGTAIVFEGGLSWKGAGNLVSVEYVDAISAIVWRTSCGHWRTEKLAFDSQNSGGRHGWSVPIEGARVVFSKEVIVMDDTLSVALYARVSSQRQADELTIQSQLAGLKQRISDEHLTLDEGLCFLDDGYCGDTLLRPALRALARRGLCGRDRSAVRSFA